MYIEQLYTKCLSAFAYYVESDGEAAIIDPMRDIDIYLDLAKKRGASIKYIFETHFHADFVSGHIDLAAKTGAAIVFGPGAQAGYRIYTAHDGEEFKLGTLTLKLLHTPGHTLESSCLLLLDDRHNPHSVFTGDTLFVNDVGRPDLAVNSTYSKEQLTGMLYDSIHSRLLPLPNYVIVYPGHGAGSACGKSIGTELHSTIGKQRKSNYALKADNQAAFIKLVNEGLMPPPVYFFMDAAINQNGYSPFEEVLKKNLKPLDAIDVQNLIIGKSAMILDTRHDLDFANRFIPGSVNIGLDGPFAGTAGNILDPATPLIIVAGEGDEREAVLRLARVGFENVAGFLQGGIEAWVDAGFATDSIACISAEEFEDRFRYNSCNVIDVRNPDEWVPGFVSGAKLISLPELEKSIASLDPAKTTFIYCARGYRSIIACSLLRRHNFTNVVNVTGGMNRIRKTALSISQLSSLTG